MRANRVGAVGELYIDDESMNRAEISGSNRILLTTTPIYFGGVDPDIRGSMKDNHVDVSFQNMFFLYYTKFVKSTKALIHYLVRSKNIYVHRITQNLTWLMVAR